MTKQILNRSILLTLTTLVISMFLFEISGIDLMIQNGLYDFKLNEWIVDRDNLILRLIFYDGIKRVLILFGVMILLTLIFCRKTKRVHRYKSGLIIVIFSAALVPSIVVGLKSITNVPCPKNITHFNGCYPYIRLFTPYPSTFHQKGKVACFPAGHASGGFALLSLFFLFKSRKNRRRAIISAMAVGWSMGLYKMLIGDHFFSHTFITMVLAWLIILVVARITIIYFNIVEI